VRVAKVLLDDIKEGRLKTGDVLSASSLKHRANMEKGVYLNYHSLLLILQYFIETKALQKTRDPYAAREMFQLSSPDILQTCYDELIKKLK